MGAAAGRPAAKKQALGQARFEAAAFRGALQRMDTVSAQTPEGTGSQRRLRSAAVPVLNGGVGPLSSAFRSRGVWPIRARRSLKAVHQRNEVLKRERLFIWVADSS